ncbi:MAG: hypothetical protein A2157_10870 [Deltaproteobacteria bacterium RBG_16_47_11]|nr:MAG: hypothetical protein A2157_10870 [Deltaproteobacteria bacterium RBG_16_47_11]
MAAKGLARPYGYDKKEENEMEPIKIVVRYADGKVMKGFTQDFFPNKDRFHLIPADKPLGRTIEVTVKQLKAVFVVRDFFGNPNYIERKRYIEGEKPFGVKVEVMFADGEVMVGSTLSYNLKHQGFFLSPADPKSNNIRVFVVSSAVKKVRQLYGYLEDDRAA